MLSHISSNDVHVTAKSYEKELVHDELCMEVRHLCQVLPFQQKADAPARLP